MAGSAGRSLYESDVVTWAAEQVRALGQLEASGVGMRVDWRNVIRTIEIVGHTERELVQAAASEILAGAIKGYIDPDSPLRFRWALASFKAGSTVRRLAVGSIRERIDLDRLWAAAFDAALPEVEADLVVGVPPGLPKACPITWDDLRDEGFTYEVAVRRLYDGLNVPAESETS